VSGPRKYIAVAGNIGAGKSTLVDFLRQRFGLTPFFEPNADNPFLPLFYDDMQRWAFHSQIYFLTHKFRLHQQLTRHSGTVIQDRTIYEDAEIFAENLYRTGMMSPAEYATYRAMYDGITRTLRPPDLMIYLRASVRTVRRRIRLRGRPEEQALPLDYIKRLHNLYEGWFETYDRSPTLVIPIDKLDYIQDMLAHIDFITTVEKYL
jgi:deoxyadenosine/deoxycytidine kinase